MQASFETLRSMLNMTMLDDAHREALWALLCCGYDEQPEVYFEQWRPYLAGFPHHFEATLATVNSMEALALAVEIVPNGRFYFENKDARFGDEGVRRLVDSPFAQALNALYLGDCQLTNQGVEMLAQSSALSSLQVLDLNENPFGDDAVHALAESPYLCLTSLILWGTFINDRHLRVLAGSQHLSTLHALDLMQCDIEGHGIESLATSPFFGGLLSLDLSDNSISTTGLCALVRFMTSLRSLFVWGCSITDESLGQFMTHFELSSLRHLNLSLNTITSEGAKVLAQSPRLAELRTLDLSYNNMDDEGARALANSPYLASLEALDVSDNDALGVDGFRALARSSYLSDVVREQYSWALT